MLIGAFGRVAARSARMSEAAVRHARSFGWATAAAATADVYAAALDERRLHRTS
jgi:D-inositol-3-phosphate glycosyltransferase